MQKLDTIAAIDKLYPGIVIDRDFVVDEEGKITKWESEHPKPTKTTLEKSLATYLENQAIEEGKNNFLVSLSTWIDKAFDLAFFEQTTVNELAEMQAINAFFDKRGYLPPLEKLSILYPDGVSFMQRMIQEEKIEPMPTLPKE